MLKSKGWRILLLRTRAVALMLLMIFLVALKAPPSFAVKGGEHLQDIRVIADGFSYQAGKDGGRREYRFSGLAYVQASGPFVCHGNENPHSAIDKSLSPAAARESITINLNEAVTYGDKEFTRHGLGQKLVCLPLYWEHKDAAARFAGAVNRMIWENSAEVRAQRQQQFEQKVAEWRTAGSKTELPEDARTHKVLAENAYQEKNLPKAISEYNAALQIFPTWPVGQFNVALICGETGAYDCAVEHMQNYLELVPNAPDAEGAKDKLIIWRDKLESSQTSSPPPESPHQ